MSKTAKYLNLFDREDLLNLSKEELIEQIRILHTSNIQLKNEIRNYRGMNSEKRGKRFQRTFDFDKCNYRHVLLKFMYIGWDYHGYVVQETTTNTVEHYLFEALIKTCLIKDRTSSNYHRCGRTDKGVSAFGQVISIDLRSQLSAEHQNDVDKEINYCTILNKVLPDTIQCIAWCPVKEDFSARFDCNNRVYKYFFPKGNLNIQKMQQASEYLVGTHDYRNFCKMDVGNGVVKFIRTILSIDILPINENCKNEEYNFYVITVMGKAFLWHQIRCLMGILFLIGQNKEQVEIIQELLDVDKNPRKPDYNMAMEVPLNLYCCEYDIDTDWVYDYTSLNILIQKLQAMWTFNSVKSTMLEYIINDLHKIGSLQNDRDAKNTISYINCLLNGVKSKKYIPLLDRQKCVSLEDRISHYIKRQKLDIFTNDHTKPS